MKVKTILKKLKLKIMANSHYYKKMDDAYYLKKMYKIILNKELDLKNPQTFNEKLQWLKLYDRKDIYTTMVDKYAVKKYVADIIGEEYIIPTLGIYNSFDEIDFDELPNQFVIKCTHDSGGLVIVKDKSKLDIKSARKRIDKSLEYNFYYFGREWPYKNVKPRIIIDKYMEDESKKELKDYKIFCFGGTPKIIMVDSGRFFKHKRNVYDTSWNKLNVNINFPTDDNMQIKKPRKLNELIELSEKLSENIPFIRTDFYVINDKVYFGELTFFPGSGFQRIEPDYWQKKLGDLINLTIDKNIKDNNYEK